MFAVFDVCMFVKVVQSNWKHVNEKLGSQESNFVLLLSLFLLRISFPFTNVCVVYKHSMSARCGWRGSGWGGGMERGGGRGEIGGWRCTKAFACICFLMAPPVDISLGVEQSRLDGASKVSNGG